MPLVGASFETAAAPVVAVLGGTGQQGRGLARRLAMAGRTVLVGSRDAARAEQAAAELGAGGAAGIRGGTNADVARAADVVVVAVPWQGHAELLRELADDLAGKLVVDCVNPLERDERGPKPVAVPEGSAAEQAAALLPRSRVVAAFHHISAKVLLEGDEPDETDVLVVGDDREAKQVVMELADAIAGLRGVDAGPLRLARWVEGMTAVIIAVNRRYKTRAGLRVTGI
jgi:8-hydroxy-5-deazaflavin:NADPH oxidoreductase